MTTEEVRDNVRKILREQYFSEEEAMVDEVIIAMAKEKTDLWWKRLKSSGYTLIACLLIAGGASGQVASPVPQLSETERLALKAVTEEIAQVNKDYAALQAEVMKNHPGFTLNAQSGQLEPIKAAAPEPKVKK